MVTPTLPMDLQGRPKEGPQFQETHLPLWEGTWPPLQQPAGSPLKVSFQFWSSKNHSPLALQYVLLYVSNETNIYILTFHFTYLPKQLKSSGKIKF